MRPCFTTLWMLWEDQIQKANFIVSFQERCLNKKFPVHTKAQNEVLSKSENNPSRQKLADTKTITSQSLKRSGSVERVDNSQPTNSNWLNRAVLRMLRCDTNRTFQARYESALIKRVIRVESWSCWAIDVSSPMSFKSVAKTDSLSKSHGNEMEPRPRNTQPRNYKDDEKENGRTSPFRMEGWGEWKESENSKRKQINEMKKTSI